MTIMIIPIPVGSTVSIVRTPPRDILMIPIQEAHPIITVAMTIRM
jgi:hypothetical protein